MLTMNSLVGENEFLVMSICT